MTVGNARQELVQEGRQDGQVQARIANVQILFQVLIEEFKDQREFAFRVDHIEQSHDIGMLQFLEQ